MNLSLFPSISLELILSLLLLCLVFAERNRTKRVRSEISKSNWILKRGEVIYRIDYFFMLFKRKSKQNNQAIVELKEEHKLQII